MSHYDDPLKASWHARAAVVRPWEQDKAAADNFTRQVTSILRQNAGLFVEIVTADEEADQKRATDFIVRVTGGDVACRIRKDQYWPKPGDITIRNRRPSGVKTEADKIIEGYARWMFYAWARWPVGPLLAWVLIDLDRLRDQRLIESAREERHIMENWDGSSNFVYLLLPDLDQAGAIVVKSPAVADYLNANTSQLAFAFP